MWSPSLEYDNGKMPAVAINGSAIVEVHKASTYDDLWCRVAAPLGGFGESQQYDEGIEPSVAVNGLNQVVETHRSQDATTLWYHVGTLQPASSSIAWGPSLQYDNGKRPAVAMNDNGDVVEVHETQGDDWGLWYRVGKLNFAAKTISWGTSVNYDSGVHPWVAMNNLGQIVEVHQTQGGAKLWYHVGQLNADQTIDFGPSYQYEDGVLPAVALNDQQQLIEVHQPFDTQAMLYCTGLLSADQQKVVWSASKQYDEGYSPRVAVNNQGVVREVHKSQNQNTNWYHIGQLFQTDPAARE
jgi:hypothetical protein